MNNSEYGSTFIEWLREKRSKVAAAMVPVALLSASCGSEKNPCDMTVYAQNVWPATPPKPGEILKPGEEPQDYGAAIRKTPVAGSEVLRGVAGNEVIEIDGWVYNAGGKPLYKHNPDDRNGTIWLRVKDGGWVSDAAVRPVETQRDPLYGYGEDTSPAVKPLLQQTCELEGQG